MYAKQRTEASATNRNAGNSIKAMPHDVRSILYKLRRDEAAALIDFLSVLKDRRARLYALEMIERYGAQKHASILLRLTGDKIAEVRWRAAELLEMLPSTPISTLRRLIGDRSELVRVFAIESAGGLDKQEIAPLIRQRLQNDRSALVRSAAADALPTLFSARKARLALQKRLQKERSARALISIRAALLRLGDIDQLSPMCNTLNDRNYRIRCAASHYLSSAVPPLKSDDVIAKLIERKRKEHSRAVRSSIETGLRRLQHRSTSRRREDTRIRRA